MSPIVITAKPKSWMFAKCCISLSLLGWLAACGSPAGPLFEKQAGLYLSRHSFNVCHGYGCNRSERVGVNGDQWYEVRALFQPVSQNAVEERERIADAIAMFETIVGPQAGTDGDLAGSTLFGRPGQLDCIDETVNTITYMSLLAKENLLTFHTLGPAVLRGSLINRPSNTATIIENKTGAQYSVDSYFHKNGAPPEIIPLDLWMTGWTPEDRDSNSEDS